MKDGGPAFPEPIAAEAGLTWTGKELSAHPGMSLRDWFAGQTLCGLLASDWAVGKKGEGVAKICFEMADVMLAEREKTDA